MSKRSKLISSKDLAGGEVIRESAVKANMIPFEVNFSNELMLDIGDLVHGAVIIEGIDEGIDVSVAKDSKTGELKKEVSLNLKHNRGVDASGITKATLDVPKVVFQDGKIQVYSVLKRTPMSKKRPDSDGNPLVYALKGERKFFFRSEDDRKKLNELIDDLLMKFFADFKIKVKGESVTLVMLPSGNALNDKFAKHVQKIASKSGMNVIMNSNALVKMTVDDFIADVYEDMDSNFCRWLYSLDDASVAKYEALLEEYLSDMKKNHNGLFSYHFIKDPDLRNHISTSMKAGSDLLGSNFKEINGNHVLLLDDTISRGATLVEGASVICDNFSPKSISALTLFSALCSLS